MKTWFFHKPGLDHKAIANGIMIGWAIWRLDPQKDMFSKHPQKCMKITRRFGEKLRLRKKLL